MEIYRHIGNLPDSARGAAVAIGNFDGVHLGHQVVIAKTAEIAAAQGIAHGVLSFEPHPRSLFRPDEPPFRLTTAADRITALRRLGVAHFYELAFDTAFAAMTAESFVADVLCAGLGVAHVVVGEDFRFGHGRAGDVALLRRLGQRFGFGVTAIAPVTHDNGVVYSSTNIRRALRAGHPRDAARLLGRPWEIAGEVVRGDRRGRLLGFPTANIPLGAHLRPAAGVYAVQLGFDGMASEPIWHAGVANIGRRPSFGGDDDMGLEVHLFDFDQDIYGRAVRVRLIDFIRPERRFDGVAALKAQIAADCDAARSLLVEI